MNGAGPWSPLLWSQMAAVSAGAVAGALLRWRVSAWLNPVWAGFPVGTLAINCGGGLLAGLALAWFEQSPNELLRLLAITGFLGGMTTFSSFSLESLGLLQRGAWVLALAHTLGHVVGALGFAALGAGVGRAVLR